MPNTQYDLLTPDNVSPAQLAQGDPASIQHQDDVERGAKLQQIGRVAQHQFQFEASRLLGQQKTVENIKQIERINKEYQKLQKFLHSANSVDNSKAIDQFEKSESQRIKLLGGEDPAELVQHLNSLVTSATKFNLNLGISENETKAWDTVVQKKLDLDVAIKNEDHGMILSNLQGVEGLMYRYINEGILDPKRAELYLQGIKRSAIKNLVAGADDRVNLLLQTSGYEETENFINDFNRNYSDYRKLLPPDIQFAWNEKLKAIKFEKSNIRSAKKNYEDVQANFLRGYSNINSMIKTNKNYIDNINKAIPFAEPKDAEKLKRAKNKAIGELAISNAIKTEFKSVSEGVKDEYQLLNPNLTPAELSAYMSQVFAGSPNKQPDTIGSAYQFRAKLLSPFNQGSRDNIHQQYQSLIDNLSNVIGNDSPIRQIKEPRAGILGIYDMMENDIKSVRQFGHKASVSQKSVDLLKQAIQSPQDPVTNSQIREVVRKLKDNYGFDISDLLIEFSSKNKASDVENPNFVSFIDAYGPLIPNIGGREGYRQAESFLRNNNTDFTKAFQKSSRMISDDPGLMDSISKISQASGYDMSIILNAFATDSALGVMNGQFGIGADVFNKREKDDALGIAQPISDYLSENMEEILKKYDFVGRTTVIQSDSDPFRARNNIDRAVLGVFDTSLSETGFFERTGENLKGLFTSSNPVRNLIPKQQKRFENFVSSILPKKIDLSGRVRITPATNGFYQIMVDNGYGGSDPVIFQDQPLVINPILYKSMSKAIEDINLDDDENHEVVADFLIDLVTFSNRMPRDEKFGNLNDDSE